MHRRLGQDVAQAADLVGQLDQLGLGREMWRVLDLAQLSCGLVETAIFAHPNAAGRTAIAQPGLTPAVRPAALTAGGVLPPTSKSIPAEPSICPALKKVALTSVIPRLPRSGIAVSYSTPSTSDTISRTVFAW